MEQLSLVVQRLESTDDTEQAYCCMTEVPTPWPDALCQCRDWVAHNLGKYVDGFHLQIREGEVVGHLYYALSQRALIPYNVEAGIGVIYCEWIQQRFQKQGLRDHLMDAFMSEMQRQAAKGVLVECTDVKGQMHSSRYLSLGYQVIFESGNKKLLYLPMSQTSVDIHPLQPRIEPRQGLPVEIVILNGYMCPYEVSTQELVRQVAPEFGDRVMLREVTLTPETLPEYGIAKGILINGRQKLRGGETEEAIRLAISEEL